MHVFTEPSSDFKKSFLESLEEQSQEPLRGILRHIEKSLGSRKLLLNWLTTHFDDYVQQLKGAALGINLPPGYAPQTHVWLIAGTNYIGRCIVRHALDTPKSWNVGHISYEVRPSMRRLGFGQLLMHECLEIADSLALPHVYVVVHPRNTASKKIILRAKGELSEQFELNHQQRERYIIRLRRNHKAF